jgi:hypothetical protein
MSSSNNTESTESVVSLSEVSSENSTPLHMRPPLPPKTAHRDRPIQPDFSFMESNSANMLYTAYICVNKSHAWDALANFNELSYMFCEDPFIKELMYKINETYNGHSGCSLGWTMRQLECIAKFGYTEYSGLYTNIISQI